MSAMKSEMGELREETASLRTQLCERERQAEEAKEKLRAEAEERLAETKEASELSIARHLGFIDRLLADKQELSKQCEALGAQMKALEDKYVASAAKREEAFAKELKKQKEVWGQSEKAKRETWLAEKTKEIKESTVRGLEPDIQRLISRHRDESHKLEESLREEHRREMASEASRAQREMGRLQEASIADRHAAVERERETCATRLQEMSLHFEEQSRAQRSRQSSAATAEIEQRDEVRRREIARLEEELRAAKAKEDETIAKARADRVKLTEQMSGSHAAELAEVSKAHAMARAEWEVAFDAEVARRVEEQKGVLEAEAAAQRTAQIGKVVDKLGVEMEAAERRATQQHELRVREMRADHAKALSQLQAERTELQTKYMKAVEVSSAVEARLRHVSDELDASRADALATSDEAQARREEAEETRRRWAEGVQAAELEAGRALAQAEGERKATIEELTRVRAELHQLQAAHAHELTEARALREGELHAVEDRVRNLQHRKDSTIGALQAQVAALQAELHTTREQLHATQQEILTFQ